MENTDYSQQLKKIPNDNILLLRLLPNQFFSKFGDSSRFATKRLTVNRVKANSEHLTKYRVLCGFNAENLIPETYPQLMLMPLMYQLFLDKSFPFRMLGLIHKSHTYTQHEAMPNDGFYDLSCETTDLNTDKLGLTFDVVSSVSINSKIYWTSKATFLIRQRRKSNSAQKKTKKNIIESIETFTNSTPLNFEADIGRRYAAISRDYNPIHLYKTSAKLFGFQQPIAHGLYILAKVAAALESTATFPRTTSIEFKAPIFLPNTVNLKTSADDSQLRFIVCSSNNKRVFAKGQIEA